MGNKTSKPSKERHSNKEAESVVEKQSNNGSESNLSNLKISDVLFKDHSEALQNPGSPSIAFKNLTSYAIGTTDGRLIVVQDSQELFSGNLEEGSEINNIVYVDHLNCYLLHSNNKI